MSISVLGAGAFGTALAISLAQGQHVTLWGRDTQEMVTSRENSARLAGHRFPTDLRVTDDLSVAAEADIILLAIPMQKLRLFLEECENLLPEKICIACCKGLELETGLGPTSIISETVPSANPAILTGPSFADDIAKGLPTALALACENDQLGKSAQIALSRSALRIYTTPDIRGAELGGALKNVVAIACGAAIGAGFGESARAALMTRGFAEMQRLALRLGADTKTLAGLSGFGDLVLTCTSDKSRNYRYGHALGAKQTFDFSTTVEGAATAKATAQLAGTLGVEMPITEAIAALIDNRQDVETAMHSLLSRSLKQE